MKKYFTAYVNRKKMELREHTWSQFLLNISVAVILFALGIFIGLLLRNNHLINNEIQTRAKAHVRHIIKTREWNSNYGGVYVEKKEGIESNPYLKNPDITAVDGKTYTLKNPALMTREISELFEKDGLLTFHMTSLKPLNPENRPDEFERAALELFEKGREEVFDREKAGYRTNFRYMVPLFIEEPCLRCHAEQGYKPGDLRGGISVKFDITNVERSILLNDLIILLLGTVSVVTLLGIIYSFTFVLKRKLERAQEKIREMAVIDDLTGLYNRRYFFSRLNYEVKRCVRSGESLGCIMLDIDFFKEVNDRYGHHAGDLVLKNIADTVRSSCRETDTVARYGGEEIVILLPGADLKGAYNAAEKIRAAVGNLQNNYEKNISISVTASLGAASFTSEDMKNIADNNLLIKYADSAMYRAKEKGRNRVEIAENIVM